MGIDRDFDNLLDEEDLEDYGCDDVQGHIAACKTSGHHMISYDEYTNCCNNCGHKG